MVLNRDMAEYLDCLGFPLEGPLKSARQVRESPQEVSAELLLNNETVISDWEANREAALACQACRLCETRKNVVFGVGSTKTEVVFVGEGPGADEDIQGEPFVGNAGQLLNKMIAAMGLTRETIYITNVVKCRPPGNRNPEPDEISACSGYLEKQLALIRPKVVVALGKVAAQALLKTEVSISQMRGRFQTLPQNLQIKVMPTFHPAFLLRNPDAKKDAWSDLKLVMQELNL